MKAPDKIYIFQDGDEHWYKPEEWETPPSNRIEYTRKDALLEWAKEKQEQMKIEAGGCYNMLAAGKFLAFEEIIEKINAV